MLLLVRFVDESTGFLAPASVEDFRADLDIGYATAAAMFVTYGVGGVVGNLVVAATDGRSRKGVTVGGALTTAASLLIIGAATGGWMMLLGTGVIAVGSTMLVHGGEIAITNALAAEGLDHELERVLARGNLFAVVGDMAAPLALAALRAAGVDWRWVFAGAAAMVLVYAAVLAGETFPAAVDAAAVEAGGGTPLPVRRQRLVHGRRQNHPTVQPHDARRILNFQSKELELPNANKEPFRSVYRVCGDDDLRALFQLLEKL